MKVQRGIQSIEVGGQLLIVLAHATRSLALGDLAREAGMDASKAHRYLVSFGKLGLVKQSPASGNYELGPLAAQLGLAALRRLDPLREATFAAEALVARIGHTVAIAALGHLGPTVVRIEESVHPLHVNMRTGTVMSLLNTATGLVFAAHLPWATIDGMLEHEAMRLYGDGTLSGAASSAPAPHASLPPPLARTLQEVRRRGLARAVGKPIPGINALSVPVFDFNGRVVLAMTALGPAGTFDPSWDGDLANTLKICAEAVSRRLGSTVV